MFETYKNRMAHKGRNMSEMLRMQSNMVIEQTWKNDPNYRQVYVVRVNSGVPKVTSEHSLIDVKFNIDTYPKIVSDDPAYLIQFRHGEERNHPEIDIGSYVYMRDEDGMWKWWLICYLDERPSFRQYQILECNWTFGWVSDGKIRHCLGVQRYQNSYNSGSYELDRTTAVDNITGVFLPTNDDTATIEYSQRFLISDIRRKTPLAWMVSKIEDTTPLGLTKLKLTQETFDPEHDNRELMLANYYDTVLPPVSSDDIPKHNHLAITYNGTKPTVKVGGSAKVFTVQLPEDNHFDIKWWVADANTTYGTDTYENYTNTFGDYVVTTTDRTLHLKVAKKYDLIGTVLTIRAECADGSVGEVKVEVIG